MGDNRFIFDAVRHYAETRGDHAALIYGERVTSYGDLGLRANQVANGLVTFGLEPQCRIAILTGNNDYIFEIWLGAALAGLVLTPINARLAPPEIAYIVNDSQAEVLIVDGPFQDLVEGIAGELVSIRQIISLHTHPEWPHYPAWRDQQLSDQITL